MSSTRGRSSTLSPPLPPAQGFSNNFPQVMPRFPLQGWLARSDSQTSSDPALPENSISWSSLQTNQTKKQKASGDATTSPKQSTSSYYSVDETNLTKADSVLIPAQRRRAQNRASQRAFRERKERHVKNLEEQLEELHQQYEDLRHAYEQQKQEIFHLKEELHGFQSESDTFQVPHNSPLDFPSATGGRGFPGDVDRLRLSQHGNLIPHSQSMTPVSTFTNQNSTSRTSVSEEHTPFGSLLPLTPGERFESSTMFCPPDPFLASGETTRSYNIADFPEVRQQHEQQDDFGSPGFSKEFAINPTADIFEGWR